MSDGRLGAGAWVGGARAARSACLFYLSRINREGVGAIVLDTDRQVSHMVNTRWQECDEKEAEVGRKGPCNRVWSPTRVVGRNFFSQLQPRTWSAK